MPETCGWPCLTRKDGDELFDHYRHTLEALGNRKGLLGLIFNKSQNKFRDPAKLRRLIVDLIDNETWVSMSSDVKGDVYEGLLERNAQDTRSGAGQYFTPRPQIQAVVDVMAPQPGETMSDPACGTGGFLLAAHDYVVKHNPTLTRPRSDMCITYRSKWMGEHLFKALQSAGIPMAFRCKDQETIQCSR